MKSSLKNNVLKASFLRRILVIARSFATWQSHFFQHYFAPKDEIATRAPLVRDDGMAGRNIFLLGFACLALSGCGITDNLGKTPAIYAVRADDSTVQKMDVPLTKPVFLTLADFAENSMLATIRIPILSETNRIRYVKDATWVDTPGVMLNQQLNELLQNSGDKLVVSNYQERVRSDYLLQGQLMRFYYSQADKRVDIKLDLKYFHMPGKKLQAEKQFIATVPVPDEGLEQIVKGFNIGTAQLLNDVRLWLYANL